MPAWHSGLQVRRVVADDEQIAARGDRRGEPPHQRLARRHGKAQVLQRGEVVVTPWRLPVGEVALQPCDPPGDLRRGLLGPRRPALEGDDGDVDGGHLKAALGQPDRVCALTGAGVECRSGKESRRLDEKVGVGLPLHSAGCERWRSSQNAFEVIGHDHPLSSRPTSPAARPAGDRPGTRIPSRRRARPAIVADPRPTPTVGSVADDELPRQVLVVTAHPDDVDFGAAGTIARWTAAGVEVAYCVITDGDSGALDPSADVTTLSMVRREEQRRAAAAVGVQDVRFLGYPDGRLVVSLELRRDVSRVIREVRPDRLLAPSPERAWERLRASHPDHLAAGEATLCAVYPDARNPFAFPELLDEGLQPHAVPEVWLMASPRANRAVDITDVFAQKLAALRCHVSQVGAGDELEGRLREFGGRIAADQGLPAGRLAEAFQVVVTA